MTEHLAQLQRASQSQHGGHATPVRTVPMADHLQGKQVWEGLVRVFDLADDPTPNRADVWSSPFPNSEKRRFFAVLHGGAIQSPLNAVQASTVAEASATEP